MSASRAAQVEADRMIDAAPRVQTIRLNVSGADLLAFAHFDGTGPGRFVYRERELIPTDVGYYLYSMYAGGCDSCGQPDELYLLRDDLWGAVVHDGERYLCLDCVRRRLGRPLVPADFEDVCVNLRWRTLLQPRRPDGIA